MIDMDQTIIPKSDQLNSDDLMAGRTITVTITNVSKGNAEQPISISFEGDNGKPYRPGKSMRRVLRQIWGRDGQQYVGRSMTLYCDPSVKFGGMEVGGIRISHMSHMESEVRMALTATKGKKAAFIVRPLKAASTASAAPVATPPASTAPPSEAKKKAMRVQAAIEASADAADLDVLWTFDYKPELDALKKDGPKFYEALEVNRDQKLASFSDNQGDDIAP